MIYYSNNSHPDCVLTHVFIEIYKFCLFRAQKDAHKNILMD